MTGPRSAAGQRRCLGPRPRGLTQAGTRQGVPVAGTGQGVPVAGTSQGVPVAGTRQGVPVAGDTSREEWARRGGSQVLVNERGTFASKVTASSEGVLGTASRPRGSSPASRQLPPPWRLLLGPSAPWGPCCPALPPPLWLLLFWHFPYCSFSLSPYFLLPWPLGHRCSCVFLE